MFPDPYFKSPTQNTQDFADPLDQSTPAKANLPKPELHYYYLTLYSRTCSEDHLYIKTTGL